MVLKTLMPKNATSNERPIPATVEGGMGRHILDGTARKPAGLIGCQIDDGADSDHLIAGAIGGAGVGKASPNFDLGTVGNIVSGLVGGGVLEARS
jgi:hypothetical protein